MRFFSVFRLLKKVKAETEISSFQYSSIRCSMVSSSLKTNLIFIGLVLSSLTSSYFRVIKVVANPISNVENVESFFVIVMFIYFNNFGSGRFDDQKNNHCLSGAFHWSVLSNLNYFNKFYIQNGSLFLS